MYFILCVLLTAPRVGTGTVVSELFVVFSRSSQIVIGKCVFLCDISLLCSADTRGSASVLWSNSDVVARVRGVIGRLKSSIGHS